MASTEHCLHCFDALVARLDRREALDLAEVERLWALYCRSGSGDDSVAGEGNVQKRLSPAMQRLAGTGSSSGISSASSGSSMSLATETTATSMSTSSLPLASDSTSDSALITESPLFVTWNTISSRSGSAYLRGCIGTFETQELDEGLAEYAITSALHDSRFDPMEKHELPTLEVAVTLLTDFEDCDNSMDWELGKHGLRISFTDRGERYGATYLPDVATEQGWTRQETLISLMRKAGWTGKKDKWQDVKMNTVRYQGKKKSLRYAEYKKWKDWVDQRSEP